jgi:hypothetical protein
MRLAVHRWLQRLESSWLTNIKRPTPAGQSFDGQTRLTRSGDQSAGKATPTPAPPPLPGAQPTNQAAVRRQNHKRIFSPEIF